MTIHKQALHFALLFTMLFLLAAGANADNAAKEEYPEDLVARVQKNYDNMNSLTFSFNQRSQGQMSGRPRTGSGNALFHKSADTSRMRWNYQEPDQQVLISDGKLFSMYFEELQQMIVTPAAQLEDDLTYSFFSGKARIADSFHILPPDPHYLADTGKESAIRAVKLVPREPQSQLQSIHLWVDDESLIRRLEIRDQFDTITLLTIRDIKVNGLADISRNNIDKLFTFTPPEGTEIIRQ